MRGCFQSLHKKHGFELARTLVTARVQCPITKRCQADLLRGLLLWSGIVTWLLNVGEKQPVFVTLQ